MTKHDSKDEKPIENENLSEENSSGTLSETSNNSQEAKLPRDIEDALPDEVKDEYKKRIQTIQQMTAFSLESRREVSPLIELASKVQSSHIDQLLKNDAANDERSFKDSQISKRYTLIYVIIICVVFVFITVFLVIQNVSVYTDLLKIFVGFVGGLGSGFGLSKRNNKG